MQVAQFPMIGLSSYNTSRLTFFFVVDYFIVYGINWQDACTNMIGKNLEETSHNQFDVISLYLPGETEENHEES
jgi:hypothetical protein